MKVIIIVAVSENGVIGNKNNLPWHLPDDMKFFKEKTKGCAIITGRKNYESIPEKYRPLPGRYNIVMTTQKDYEVPSTVFKTDNIEDAFEAAYLKPCDYAFVIGGGEIYREALKHGVSEIFLTRVHANIEGDVTFPELNMENWKLVEETHHPADEKHQYAFTFSKYIPNTFKKRIEQTN